MGQLIVDFIISLDGYASAEGWPGWWGIESPEYLAWLNERPDRDHTLLMGANTYRLMHGFATSSETSGDEAAAFDELTRQKKIVFSSSLEEPLEWANSELVREDPVKAVADMKARGMNLSTIGSLTLARSLLEAGLVDLYRVGIFPVITGTTGRERIWDGYPDAMLELVTARTFDNRIQLLEYVPRLIEGPPGAGSGS